MNDETVPVIRQRLRVTGVVQGVGFRPTVYQLAMSLDLNGFVGNDSAGVFVELEGPRASIDDFVLRLLADPPPLAHIDAIERRDIDPAGDTEFAIVESRRNDNATTLVSPDLDVCADCRAEMNDPQDRRYRYPFINCTNCGPRFTITRETPYDRPLTTMASFLMCDRCQAEYDDPANRRFHAQPNACADCGPHVWLEKDSRLPVDDVIAATRARIAAGEIVAIKGIGGFHLACDARNADAVATLRERKHRTAKPFAVMAADLATAEAVTDLVAEERRLLESRERPIVLVKESGDSDLVAGIAPGNSRIGVMLPYAPLHHLLLEPGDVWVMTSANYASEPIVKSNTEARAKLGELADVLLLHDRSIHVHCDDSVVRVAAGAELPVRRSRGFAPFPVRLPIAVPPTLAVGGELKATFCLADGKNGFMSQHIGDMENLETLDAFTAAVEHMTGLFRIEPERVVADMHPRYLSSRWAEDHYGDRLIRIQHHHAHIGSVMAESGHTGPVIGFSFDGTGYGTDGTIWGGEILVGDLDGLSRVGHLGVAQLVGGDAAVKRPYRMALSHLWAANVDWDKRLPPVVHASEEERRIVRQQLETGLNSIETTSIGRLFDAVASIAGIRQEISYEGQAAIELEALGTPDAEGEYRFDLITTDTGLVLDPGAVIAAVAGDVVAEIPVAVISTRFHRALASAIVAAAREMRQRYHIDTAALSGGVFQNVTLLEAAKRGLEESGFEVLVHRLVPPNDGGLALGQVALAGRR
ncbi:MAG: carbamoyltransferase HypF [Acidimicrobiia bacterium]|nr:carbamoyltransferase HypF [Acidimicrobiia bacterium]MDX2468771.1 carbamoyltransferase HypF [Acidimicrobiia bacterium]